MRGSADGRAAARPAILDLEGVRYTACPAGSDDWELSAGSISIDQETRIGTGRNVRLEFMGVPILYAPWLSFPVGDQRKTGFLFPTSATATRPASQIAVP